MHDGKQESGSGEPGAEMNKAAETPVEGENAEKSTVNAEGEHSIELASSEKLPEPGPVIDPNSDTAEKSTEEAELPKKSEPWIPGEARAKTDDEVRIGELLKERSELLAKIEELTMDKDEVVPPNATLMAEVEVTSMEPNGAAGDKHGYTVRVKPTPGAYHLPYEFSLGMITSYGAKKLAIGKKYHITVTEA